VTQRTRKGGLHRTLLWREVHVGFYRIIYGVCADEFQVVTIVHMKQRVTRRRLR
jgi:mRNA-degrading endonuclease RelE of RelBE toxin-antitoxin system